MLYSITRSLFVLYFKVFYRCKFKNLHNIPSGVSFIVCSNHTSNLDPPFVGCVIPRNKVHFMAKEELFKNRLLSRLLVGVGAFPVKRGAVDKGALTHALRLLKDGCVVGLFPEGKRMKAGALGEIFHGPAFLALKSKKPILPMAIKWPERIFQPVRVSVGPLIHFEDEDKTGRKALESASAMILEEMTRLWSGL
jgi:1-acyl-sn-glycerol-3-phosphate acyltransferase